MTESGRWASDRNALSSWEMGSAQLAMLFDLDGTLIDSVYQHVLSWRDALESEGIDLPVWRIHRKIGMSGGLFARALLRETGAPLEPERLERLQLRHEEIFGRYSAGVRPLPGAKELLGRLTGMHVPWAIATSGRQPRAGEGVSLLDVGADVPVITRDLVRHAKPDPDLFLAAAAALGVPIESCVVVGDSVWDLLAARRARALGVGVLSGGYGEEELEKAGAFRVYEDPLDLLAHLDEVGVREHAEAPRREPQFRRVASMRPLVG
jgi:HAD superfamily hydrolase (TIGR01509 family)